MHLLPHPLFCPHTLLVQFEIQTLPSISSQLFLHTPSEHLVCPAGQLLSGQVPQSLEQLWQLSSILASHFLFPQEFSLYSTITSSPVKALFHIFTSSIVPLNPPPLFIHSPCNCPAPILNLSPFSILHVLSVLFASIPLI